MAASKAARVAAAIALCAAIFSVSAPCTQAIERAPLATIEIPKEAVSRKTLDNGLTVFIRRSLPKGLVAIDVKIRAGSSLEGKYLGSGISHLVEHMVFKGTPKRGAGQIEREIKSYGGIVNGSTSADITSYHMLIPSDKLAEGLDVMTDMLANAVFDNSELSKEKEVVLKEINLNEDEPQSRLIKRLDETAYLRHPYKYPTIGYAKPFKALTRDNVVEYYNAMYVPNRMVVTVVGDVDTDDATQKVAAAFGNFRPAAYAMPQQLPQEPAQLGMRRLEEDSRVNLAYLAMGYHSTSILDEDLFALDVLAMILGRGDNSRLNASLLKDKRLVYSITAWNNTPMDRGLFVIDAVTDKDNAAKAERAILGEIARVRESAVSDDELETARRMVLADKIASLETVDAQADDIGLDYMLTGSPDFSRRYVEGIQKVTKDDIRRVARAYLKDTNLTVVTLIPQAQEQRSAPMDGQSIESPLRKEALANGLKVILRRNTRTPNIAITVAMRGGLASEHAADNGISSLTAQMLLKGTSTRTEDKIQGYLESLGGSVEAFSGISSFGLKAEALKPDLAAVLDVIRDVVGDPTFPQEELEKEKALTIAAISEEDDDIFAVGFNALRRQVFGNAPYGLRYIGEARTVSALTRESLLSYFREHAVPNNMVISISGDIDIDKTLAMIRDRFSGLKQRELPMPSPPARTADKREALRISMDKEQSLALLGYATVSALNNDRYALEVLSSILSGTSGRLFDSLRNTQGLAYALGCSQRLGAETGYFALYAATTKDSLDKARRTMADELAKVRDRGVTDRELALAKNELRTARRIELQRNGSYSFITAIDELYGAGYDNVDRYDAAIEKVTKEDVQKAAQRYFAPGTAAEVVITEQP